MFGSSDLWPPWCWRRRDWRSRGPARAVGSGGLGAVVGCWTGFSSSPAPWVWGAKFRRDVALLGQGVG
eukprot:10037751-Lingulodinium_polyedra.AAC.1